MEQLKRLREARGLSQTKLAARADVNPATVNQIEGGKRTASPATLHKLAAALDVSLYELLEGEPHPKASSRSSLEPSLLNGLEEERHDYGSRVWERINLLDGAAEQWQRFIDEGRYDLKRMDLEDLKAVDKVSLRIVLDHAPTAAMIKRASTDEQRARLEQAERRLIDTNLEFWARVENELAHEEVADFEAFKARREEEWKQASRNSMTA